ncbi:MAG: hypothetical protein QNJ98_12115 [Planctomycetota bacterium]|nr:hypothetical protein [Planctomycetota bacterium]
MSRTPAALRRLGFVGALVACFATVLVLGCGGGGGGTSASVPPAGGPPPPPPPGPPPTGGDEILDLTVASGPLPGQVVLRFTAPTPAATSYDIRAQVPHLGPDNAPFAPMVATSHVPGAAGTQETITLSGLERGQTLQFAVRPVRGTAYGAFSHGAAARVTDGPLPAPPVGAITLFGPATLSQDNAYYVLGSDIVAGGTAFTITGRGVTLDLAGRTITYGTGGGQAYGVQVLAPLFSGTTTITNGRIVQALNNNAAYSNAVDIGGGHHHRVCRLDVTVQGSGAHCVWVYNIPTGEVRVDHNVLRCNTTSVPNRHYPGVSAVYIEDATQAVEVDHNHVIGSPQWGIKVAGNFTSGRCWIHHNRITGTKALVSNGYMIGVYKPNAIVFENECIGESRGIHLDGVDANGNNALVHDNYVFAQDQPNAEFNPHWCHGIKIENPTSATLVHNHVTVLADASHSEARALDIDVEDGGDVMIYGNRISGLSTVSTKLGKGISWLGGSAGFTPNVLEMHHNVIRATDRLVDRGWYAENGVPFMENAWLRDFSKVGNLFRFEHWGNMPTTAATGHRFIDAWTSESTTNVSQSGFPGPYTVTREWTLMVIAQNGSGQPVSGASVSVRDRVGALVFSGLTDANGRARAPLVVTRITTGPVADARGPFNVSVSGTAGSYMGTVTMSGKHALVANLSTGTAISDVTAPTAPTGVYAVPLSASRTVVRWTASTDVSGICNYLVFKDGQLERITNQLEAVISGLSPLTTATYTVQAVDGGGNVSSLSAPAFATTPVEDRGP